ncbi:putative oxidoreductase [Phycisphaerae bacterium RAS1]|nr:putative oxidoreductase [Phycisphaerae bacterium RAS1]
MPDKACIITGASRGIGLATALRLARGGYHVTLAARNPVELEAAARQVSAVGVGVEAVPVDVAEPPAAAELTAISLRRFGRIDVLINNAGYGLLAPIDQLAAAEFQKLLAVNVVSVFHLTQAVWPVMRDQRGGVIVNVSSIAAFDPFPGFAVYGACKAWVNTFTRAIAEEGKKLGIRVFAVAPGAVETQMLRSAFPSFPAEQTLDPDHVAATIEALVDERLAHCSGQTVIVKR